MTGSLQIKNGKYYAVINYKDDCNNRRQKWISTDLPVKGNKKKAEKKLQEHYKKLFGREYIQNDYIVKRPNGELYMPCTFTSNVKRYMKGTSCNTCARFKAHNGKLAFVLRFIAERGSGMARTQ